MSVSNNGGKVDIARMMGALFVICGAYSVGFMAATGEWGWRMWCAGFVGVVFPCMWAYYRGHQNGYDARQAEVKQVLGRIPPSKP
jgi:hypothetical protein